MIVFNKEGGKTIREIIDGNLVAIIHGNLAEFSEELTILLGKLDGRAPISSGNTNTLILGNPEATEALTIDADSIFLKFGITHHSMSDKDTIKSVSSLIYSPLTGEPMYKNSIMRKYITNDGQLLPYNSVSNSVNLSTKLLKKYMPDLYAQQQEAKKESGITLEIGSEVKVSPWETLVAKYGEGMLVPGVDGKGTTVADITGDRVDETIALKGINFPLLAGKVYCDKVGTIIDIDYASGAVLLDIDGTTEHNSLMINNVVKPIKGYVVTFYYGMVENV